MAAASIVLYEYRKRIKGVLDFMSCKRPSEETIPY